MSICDTLKICTHLYRLTKTHIVGQKCTLVGTIVHFPKPLHSSDLVWISKSKEQKESKYRRSRSPWGISNSSELSSPFWTDFSNFSNRDVPNGEHVLITLYHSPWFKLLCRNKQKNTNTILQLELLAQKQKSGHASLHPGLMCNDMCLSIES